MRLTFVTLLVAIAVPLAAQTPLIDQGRALMAKRDYEKAAEVLEKAVAATPKSAEAHYLLGGAYGSLAQKASIFSQASLASKTANEIKKRDSFRGHRAWAFIFNRQKKTDLARNEYIQAVREQPNSPKSHIYLASFYLSEKNNAAAATEIDSAVKADPNYMPVLFWLGRVTVATGTNYPRGEEALRKYLAYAPKQDEPGLHRAHFWLGQIYEKTGRKAEAKASYTRSLQLVPDQKDVTEALKRVS